MLSHVGGIALRRINILLATWNLTNDCSSMKVHNVKIWLWHLEEPTDAFLTDDIMLSFLGGT